MQKWTKTKIILRKIILISVRGEDRGIRKFGKSLVLGEKIVGAATIVADSRVGSSKKIVARILLCFSLPKIQRQSFVQNIIGLYVGQDLPLKLAYYNYNRLKKIIYKSPSWRR